MAFITPLKIKSGWSWESAKTGAVGYVRDVLGITPGPVEDAMRGMDVCQSGGVAGFVMGGRNALMARDLRLTAVLFAIGALEVLSNDLATKRRELRDLLLRDLEIDFQTAEDFVNSFSLADILGFLKIFGAELFSVRIKVFRSLINAGAPTHLAARLTTGVYDVAYGEKVLRGPIDIGELLAERLMNWEAPLSMWLEIRKRKTNARAAPSGEKHLWAIELFDWLAKLIAEDIHSPILEGFARGLRSEGAESTAKLLKDFLPFRDDLVFTTEEILLLLYLRRVIRTVQP